MSDYLKGKRVVDPVLTSIARGYKNAAFIGERIFPIVETDKEGVTVPTFGKTAFVEFETQRAVGADSNVLVREKTGSLDLVLNEHDLAAPVDYREKAESMFNEESKAIRRVTNGVNLKRELYAARLAQDPKVYVQGSVKALAAAERWVGGKGDPIGIIEAGIEAVRNKTGLRPNLMTMGASVMSLLKFHPAIQAAIGANERKRITLEILKDLFQLDDVVVGEPVSMASMKDAQDKDKKPSDIWADNLMLHYVGKPQPGTTSADENEPSFGYTLRRKGMPVADKYDGAGGKVNYCRYTDIYKVAVVGGDAGYLISNIVK
ncbi:Uncharacterised protein [Enterobacter hormaechei]|jgi:hypothetical protein|uniref:Phage-like protein n=1 Tax=Enterobacter intestinihominis TaxID=3133180 RepID=A0ABV1ZM72_9ENTR|nr:hypothetical protein [Enterobacter hormaechei]ELW9028304.1 hypothetical protein [Yersinia enterocolitica]QLU00866.1 hypothetical protein HV163_18475 [Enterobacter hormaechei]QLU87073.1 hypothetical protein HV254_10555 [Enterobacter hormaechei]QLV44830.1 hypothetical protein HV218_06135 [Enterobacter hormaechei]TYF75008.1 hypothetical protein DJ539_09985 [Enterobacter hormaechei]